jgi:hypothetical protein
LYNVAAETSEIGGDLLTGLALSSQLVRTPQLAHDVLRGMPLPTSHVFIVPSSPTSGHRTQKLDSFSGNTPPAERAVLPAW